MLVGTESHGINLYWNIGNQVNYNFTKDECFEFPYLGNDVKPSIYDIDSNNSLDLIAGLSTGGFLHYSITSFFDLNFDLNIDIFDIILMVNEILYPENLYFQCNADANHDTSLDVSDILVAIGVILDN